MFEFELKEMINNNDLYSIPEFIISREGHKITTTNDTWQLPIVHQQSVIYFDRIKNYGLKWLVKIFIINQIERVSSTAGLNCWRDFSSKIIANENYFKLSNELSINEFEESLITLFEKIISDARNNKNLWSIYRITQWYIWCAENYNEFGICQVYASELDAMIIPANPKGQAVRNEDPDKGPLNHALELPLLIKALKEDKSTHHHHLQQKAALALSIAFGRNPSNLTYLRESDFLNLAEGQPTPCYVIKMPRIKKRLLDPRDDYLEEYLEDEFALIIQDLIKANSSIDTHVEIDGKNVEVERPLFIHKSMNVSALKSRQFEYIFNYRSYQITRLLKSFVIRHKIISPVTKELLYISTRRLRYTLATGLAAEGISKKELARILDHSDTQHVDVYYELAGSIVDHLDKAAAKEFSKFLNFFKGELIDDVSFCFDSEDKSLSYINENNPTDQLDIGICGKHELCHLDPPYSCYLCPKFKPYKHANHELVLDHLLIDREKRLEKYEGFRLGIQLDQIISAVAQVVVLCKKDTGNV